MSEGGYIKLYRKIRDHWIWENPEYLKWWIDLLLLANHQPRKIPINGKLIMINAGEHHTSELILAKRWYINRKTVTKFLKLLEKDGMIFVKKSRQGGTTIKVLNYAGYQALFDTSGDNEKDIKRDIERDNDGTTARTSKGQQDGHKQEPEEPKEPEEVKKDILCQTPPASVPASKRQAFKPPDVDEIRAYCLERSNNIDPQYFWDFQEARAWVLSNGKKMADWKATIRYWEKNAKNRADRHGNDVNGLPAGKSKQTPGDVKKSRYGITVE